LSGFCQLSLRAIQAEKTQTTRLIRRPAADVTRGCDHKKVRPRVAA
jgi:hypothetical protein